MKVLLNDHQKEVYDKFVFESLVSRQLEHVFNRLANYIGINVKELYDEYGAHVINRGILNNGYKVAGVINREILDKIEPRDFLSPFEIFNKLMNTWGYQIKKADDYRIFLAPTKEIKYDNNGINSLYNDIVTKASENGNFYHISMVPPEDMKELRPKGGNYKNDFESHENVVYLVNTALGKFMSGDAGSFTDIFRVGYLGYQLCSDHYRRNPKKYSKYIERKEIYYNEEFLSYIYKLGYKGDKSETKVIPYYIYKVNINDEFTKSRPWKLYFDPSATGGACYVKHKIPKDKITLYKKFYYTVNTDGGVYMPYQLDENDEDFEEFLEMANNS